jgi:hypothetical protein
MQKSDTCSSIKAAGRISRWSWSSWGEEEIILDHTHILKRRKHYGITIKGDPAEALP